MNFEDKYKIAGKEEKKRYNMMLKQFKDIQLSDNEKGFILWLCRWDQDTKKNFMSVAEKLKNKQYN